MKFGLPISFGLHGVFAVAGMFVFAAPIVPLAESRIIPITIINVSDRTSVPAAQKAPESKPAPEIVEIAPQIKPDFTPDTELELEAVPVPEAILEDPDVKEVAELAVAEPDVIPVPSETAEPELEVEPVTETQPTPEPESPQPLTLDFLQSLAEQAKAKKEIDSEQRLLTAERNQIEQAERDRAQIGAGDALSTSYEDAIMRKVYQGWQIPAGAPDMESLVVTVTLTLARDGRIESAQLSDESAKRMRGDQFYTAAAESALRAVNEAAQFNFLPRAQYEKWQLVTLTFYPKNAPSVVPI